MKSTKFEPSEITYSYGMQTDLDLGARLEKLPDYEWEIGNPKRKPVGSDPLAVAITRKHYQFTNSIRQGGC